MIYGGLQIALMIVRSSGLRFSFGYLDNFAHSFNDSLPVRVLAAIVEVATRCLYPSGDKNLDVFNCQSLFRGNIARSVSRK